jgi:hypothetical protein
MTHDFDPTEPETFTSAHERFAELRRTCPVAPEHVRVLPAGDETDAALDGELC